MIDKNLLIELGWSEDLINAVTRVAEPMRVINHNINNHIVSTTNSFSVSANNQIYAEQKIRHTTGLLKVSK